MTTIPVVECVNIVAEARGDAHAGNDNALRRIPGRCFAYYGAACAMTQLSVRQLSSMRDPAANAS